MSTNQPFLVNNPSSPLTLAHFDQIQTALRALDQAEQQANLAQQAGIDTSSQLSTIQSQRAQLLKIKQVYFPGQ